MTPRQTIVLLAALTVAGHTLARVDQEPAEVAALRSKAEHGNTIAQYNLGLAYAQGQSVPVDRAEAFAWLTLASNAGGTSRALENITRGMTPEEAAQGRERLEAVLAGVADAAPRRGAAAPAKPTDASPVSGATTAIVAVEPAGATPPNAATSSAPSDAAAQVPAADLARVSGELADAWRELDALNARLKSATQAAETAASNAAQATASRDQLRAELDTAKSQLAAAEVVVREARAAAQVANAASTDLSVVQKSLVAAQTQIAASESAAKSALDRLASADAARLSAEQEAAGARRALDGVVQEKNTLQEKLDSANAAAARAAVLESQLAEARNAATASHVASADNQQQQQQAAIAGAELANARQTVASLRAQLASATRDRKWVEERIANAESARADAEQKLAELQQAATESARERDALAQRVTPAEVRTVAAASGAPAPHPQASALAVVQPSPAAGIRPTRPTAAPAKPIDETRPTPVRQRHVIMPGDTLSKISLQYYGTPNRWREIFDANRDVLRDERLLSVGTALRIP